VKFKHNAPNAGPTPPVYPGQRHVDFAIIARMDLGEVVFEPMRPSLREVDPRP
jgi:hypothetical protein